MFTLISRENTLIILASKCTKCKNAKSGAIIYARVGENRSKSRNLSNEHLFDLCFFEDTGIHIHIYIYTVYIYMYIYIYIGVYIYMYIWVI